MFHWDMRNPTQKEWIYEYLVSARRTGGEAPGALLFADTTATIGSEPPADMQRLGRCL